MNSIKEILLAFFDDEAKEVRVVIEKVKGIPLDSKITSKTRTVLELINHIAQIPRIDVDLYSGKLPTGEEAGKMEKAMNKETVNEILEVFDEGCQYLHDYFKDMKEEELLEKNLRPFYEPESDLRSWVQYLPKLTAHIALHKGILWTYLKKAKADVNMFTYYGTK
jgi:uncharacterized damage-inducible protein DinB